MMMIVTVMIMVVVIVIVSVTVVAGAVHCTAAAITAAGGFSRFFVSYKLDYYGSHNSGKGKRNQNCCKHFTASFPKLYTREPINA